MRKPIFRVEGAERDRVQIRDVPSLKVDEQPSQDLSLTATFSSRVFTSGYSSLQKLFLLLCSRKLELGLEMFGDFCI